MEQYAGGVQTAKQILQVLKTTKFISAVAVSLTLKPTL